jgi:glycosyltransferase involved in cell wall biosynthesis
MRVLHTEASPGWGGQELRILNEAEGMRARGHEVILAIQKGGGLIKPARDKGFLVYEIPFRKMRSIQVFFQLIGLIKRHHIDLINTHSSVDAWIGGLVGKLIGCPVLRTRHLSTTIRKGVNSRILYNYLADSVITTCEKTALAIQQQANLPKERCFSIPTGVNPEQIQYTYEAVAAFRKELGVGPEVCLAGTLCVLRGWKGISYLLRAAALLKDVPNLKWLIVGSGVSESHFRQEWKELGLEEKVVFTGHLSPPFTALAAMDIFLLLSWAHEGVSQASLQAAWLEKPLITTNVGGLGEVCLHEVTGFQVPVQDACSVAEAVKKLSDSPLLRRQMGIAAKQLVRQKFTLSHTLDQMEFLYEKLKK